MQSRKPSQPVHNSSGPRRDQSPLAVGQGDSGRTSRVGMEVQFRWLIIANLVLVMLVSIALVAFELITAPEQRIVLSLLSGMTLFALILAFRNILLPGRIMVPVAIGVVVTYFVINESGIHDVSMFGYAATLIMAGLTLGKRGVVIFGVLITAIAVTVGVLEYSGAYVSKPATQVFSTEIIILAVLIVSTVITLYSLVHRLGQVANEAQRNEAAQILANKELVALKESLEMRVSDRTEELARISEVMRQRAGQLATVAEVSQAIASVQDLDEQLRFIVNLVSERFGFYHVAIFLLDESGLFAVLRAANSDGGRRMLARGHRLEVGRVGMVGYVTSSGQPLIALDVGVDATLFNNPDLPLTRSEMALPLRLGSQVIGALDVQSERASAFNRDDQEVMSILANQIATAIQNARLFAETRRSLDEARAVYERYLQQSWEQLNRERGEISYRYRRTPVTRVAATPVAATPVAATHSQPADIEVPLEAPSGDESHALAVPITLRGDTLGVIHLKAPERDQGCSSSPAGHEWSEDELQAVQTIADQTAQALENILLLEDAQRRADRERLTGVVTSRMRSSLEVGSVLKTAVREISQALGLLALDVHLASDQDAGIEAR